MTRTLEKITSDAAVRLIAGLASDLGIEAYLAGGGVRDCLLGRTANDLDFALSGACEELPRLFAQRWGGSFFWLDEVRQQARVVKKTAGGMLIRDFAPLRGTTIEDDLRQRDFTINAIAMPVAGGAPIDPLRGGPDLERNLIRSCSDHTFDDDPLRLLRALRFAAELGFMVEEGTWAALCQKGRLLEGVAAERIRDELFRLLAAPGIGGNLSMLDASGLLAVIFPAILQGRGVTERLIGRAVAVERVCGELERLFPCGSSRLADYLGGDVEAGITPFSLLKLAAFLGNDEPLAAALVAERLRLGRKAGRLLALFCRDTGDVFKALERTGAERARFRYFRDREPAGPGMIVIALADGTISATLASALIAYFTERYDPAGGDLLLTGREIMALLGLEEGSNVGEAMGRLRDAETRGEVNSGEDAREFLRKNLLTNPASMR